MQTVTTSSQPKRPKVSTTPKPFHQHITFDLLVLILSRSIFHPFICFLIPLCLLATHRPFSSPPVVNSFYWACLVTIYHVLAVWNHRLAYGKARKVDLEEEVVLIAGGGSRDGLGRLMAEVYAMKGVRGVAILDVQLPDKEEHAEQEEWEEMGVKWYKCDVGRRDEVEKVRLEVLKEVRLQASFARRVLTRARPTGQTVNAIMLILDIYTQFESHPTVLMNCIAAPITTQPVVSLTADRFTSTLNANVTSHFNLISVFLPDIIASAQKAAQKKAQIPTTSKWSLRSPKNSNKDTDNINNDSVVAGGTIVTTSSILAHISPANLAPYTASKSALSSLHTTVGAEISRLGLTNYIKTILLEPGQINTSLFGDDVTTDWAISTMTGTKDFPSSTPIPVPQPILKKSLIQSPLASFLAPPLETRELIKSLSVLLDNGESGVIRMPGYADWCFGSGIWAVLPVAVKKAGRWISGIDHVVCRSGDNGSSGWVAERQVDVAEDDESGANGNGNGNENENVSADDLVVVEKE